MHDRLRASAVSELYELRLEIISILPAKLRNQALHWGASIGAMALFAESCFFPARPSSVFGVDC